MQVFYTFTVHELTLSIKKLLEGKFTDVSVRGEVSNLKEQSSGHIYFTLKDKDSQVSAVFFRGDATRTLKRPLRNGDEIVIKGELSVYAPRGSYQIIVREVEFAGIGQLLLKLHELKKKLEERGWFDPKNKKPLPKHPKTIGVVTSPTGSVIQDILNVLGRRYSGFQLILHPVKVQGEGAAEEIARAIDDMNRHNLVDVLIVGRGGGSLEDLWAFNEEIVAEAIFRSHIPIITAIGHETDTSIADHVADLRAPTPSAAAEIVIAEKTQQLQFLKTARRSIANILQLLIQKERAKIRGFFLQPLFTNTYALLGPYFQNLDEKREDLDGIVKTFIQDKKNGLKGMSQTLAVLNPTIKLRNQTARFTTIERSLVSSLQQQIRQKRERLKALEHHLLAINPKKLLTKGYCILFRENTNSVIVSAQDVGPQAKLEILLQDGKIKVTHDRTLL